MFVSDFSKGLSDALLTPRPNAPAWIRPKLESIPEIHGSWLLMIMFLSFAHFFAHYYVIIVYLSSFVLFFSLPIHLHSRDHCSASQDGNTLSQILVVWVSLVKCTVGCPLSVRFFLVVVVNSFISEMCVFVGAVRNKKVMNSFQIRKGWYQQDPGRESAGCRGECSIPVFWKIFHWQVKEDRSI